jgi:uncharacterized membrane protein
MNRTAQRVASLEWWLARTLHYGTSLASAVIGLGLGLAMIDSRFSAPRLAILRDMSIATVGIALFILLPVARVVVMLVTYLRQRDYRLGAIALLVLTVILLGFAVGLAGRHRKTPTASMQERGETVPPHAIRAITRSQRSFPAALRCTLVQREYFFTPQSELGRIEYEHHFECCN